MIRVSSRTVRARNFRNFLSENFLCELEAYEWDALYRDRDINEKITIFE